MDKKYIECGKIINTHGCRGGLKIEPWCNSAEDFTALKRLYIQRKMSLSNIPLRERLSLSNLSSWTLPRSTIWKRLFRLRT